MTRRPCWTVRTPPRSSTAPRSPWSRAEHVLVGHNEDWYSGDTPRNVLLRLRLADGTRIVAITPGLSAGGERHQLARRGDGREHALLHRSSRRGAQQLHPPLDAGVRLARDGARARLPAGPGARRQPSDGRRERPHLGRRDLGHGRGHARVGLVPRAHQPLPARLDAAASDGPAARGLAGPVRPRPGAAGRRPRSRRRRVSSSPWPSSPTTRTRSTPSAATRTSRCRPANACRRRRA